MCSICFGVFEILSFVCFILALGAFTVKGTRGDLHVTSYVKGFKMDNVESITE